jgi:hypothetical protein
MILEIAEKDVDDSEKTILKNLLSSEDYCREGFFLSSKMNTSGEDKILFTQINQFVIEYNQSPTLEALNIEIDSLRNVTEDEARACKDAWFLFNFPKSLMKNLLRTTEEFCQEKAIYLAMTKAIEIMNDKNRALQKAAIPTLLTEALSVSFDPYILTRLLRKCRSAFRVLSSYRRTSAF